MQGHGQESLASCVLALNLCFEIDGGQLSESCEVVLMLGLGSALAAGLGLPAVDDPEWSTFIQRVVDAFTPEDK